MASTMGPGHQKGLKKNCMRDIKDLQERDIKDLQERDIVQEAHMTSIEDTGQDLQIEVLDTVIKGGIEIAIHAVIETEVLPLIEVGSIIIIGEPGINHLVGVAVGHLIVISQEKREGEGEAYPSVGLRWKVELLHHTLRGDIEAGPDHLLLEGITLTGKIGK
jgi:hypothetical protein